MRTPSKKERAGEIAQNVAVSLQKLVLGFLPGGHVVDEFLNFRTKLKEDRALKFSENLKAALSEISGLDINEYDFTSEQFVDVFDSIMGKVINTKSEIKLEYFKNILVNQIADKSANEILINKVIQVVHELDELQLLIIHAVSVNHLPTLADIIVFFNMQNVHLRLSEGDELPKGIENHQVLESAYFLFFLEELVGKGIIKEQEIDGVIEYRLREIKNEFGTYMNRNLRNSGTKMIYYRTPFGKLISDYILLGD